MELVILLPIWFLFGILTAAIAASKKRSGCGWFIAGFILGPIGFVIILCLPKIEKPVDASTRATVPWSGRMKKCPYCAEEIRSEAVKCKHCGAELPTPLSGPSR